MIAFLALGRRAATPGALKRGSWPTAPSPRSWPRRLCHPHRRVVGQTSWSTSAGGRSLLAADAGRGQQREESTIGDHRAKTRAHGSTLVRARPRPARLSPPRP